MKWILKSILMEKTKQRANFNRRTMGRKKGSIVMHLCTYLIFDTFWENLDRRGAAGGRGECYTIWQRIQVKKKRTTWSAPNPICSVFSFWFSALKFGIGIPACKASWYWLILKCRLPTPWKRRETNMFWDILRTLVLAVHIYWCNTISLLALVSWNWNSWKMTLEKAKVRWWQDRYPLHNGNAHYCPKKKEIYLNLPRSQFQP